MCGGRDYKDLTYLYSVLDDWFLGPESEHIDMLIHGGANGADTLAGQWAKNHGVMEVVVPPNWTYYGKKGGLERNHWMIKLNPDIVLAFPGGTGTKHMITVAKANEIEVYDVSART